VGRRVACAAVPSIFRRGGGAPVGVRVSVSCPAVVFAAGSSPGKEFGACRSKARRIGSPLCFCSVSFLFTEKYSLYLIYYLSILCVLIFLLLSCS
jgi:hypothetical protein